MLIECLKHHKSFFRIDTWFNGTAGKDAVASGYENQEDSSRLLAQTYT